MLKESFFLSAPESGLVGEQRGDGFADGPGGGGEGSGLESVEELDVSFLLSRDDVVDQHGALRGNGFMDGGASGLADDEVV